MRETSLSVATDNWDKHVGAISLTASLFNKVKENINKIDFLVNFINKWVKPEEDQAVSKVFVDIKKAPLGAPCL
jgi:hypothetical protein